jgi:hypothetical protein
MKHECSRRIVEKSTNTKFHENPSSGSRAVPCAQTADGQTDEANIAFARVICALFFILATENSGCVKYAEFCVEVLIWGLL